MAYCEKCGKELPEGALFCPNCGNKCEPIAEAEPAAAPEAADAMTPQSEEPSSAAAPVEEPAAQEAAPAEPVETPANPVGAPAMPQACAASEGNQGAASGKKAPARKGGKGKTIVFAALALVLAGGAFAFASGVLAPKATQPPIKEGLTTEANASTDEDAGDDLKKERYEDYTVDDVKIVDDVREGKGVRFCVTNNMDQVGQDVEVDAIGTFTILDDYGDEEVKEAPISLICSDTGTEWLSYVYPGDNTVELIPASLDGVVATYESSYSGEVQKFRLDDMDSVKIEVNGFKDIDLERCPHLSEDDYEVELRMGVDEHGKPTVGAKLTNNTDYKWRSAKVYIVAVAKDGSLAKHEDGESSKESFSYGPLEEEYFNPGESKEAMVTYSKSLDVDHFEVTRVVVEKELGRESEEQYSQ